MGAADSMIQCDADHGTMTIQCAKQKDAEPFPELAFKLSTVDLGYGQSSCILEPTDLLKGSMSPEDDPTAKKMLGILEDEFGPEGATSTQWQKACEGAKISRKTFHRRLKELMTADLVTKDGDKQGARYRPAKSEPVSVSG